jgi:hypothetical protein
MPWLLHPARGAGGCVASDGRPASAALQDVEEHDVALHVPAASAAIGAPFSAITAGGISGCPDIQIAACGVYFHLYVHGSDGEAYFRVPRALACSNEHGPRGLAHVNLVSGAVGIVDKVTVVKDTAKAISVRVLADAVVSDAPASFVPGLVAVEPGAPPDAVQPGLGSVPAAMCAVEAAPAAPRRKRGRGETEPVRTSARLRGKAPALCQSVLDCAVQLKASKMGVAAVAPPIPPPFNSMEIRSMAASCQLPDAALNDIDAALLVSDGAHV